MSQVQSNLSDHPLARHRGEATLSASEAITKAILECLPSVSLLSLTDCDTLQGLIKLVQQPETRDLFRMHRLRVIVSPDANRALERAAWAATGQRHVLAILAGPTTSLAMTSLLDPSLLAQSSGSALGCIIEDAGPTEASETPGPQLVRSRLPIIEATDVEHLRECVEHTLRLSRAAGSAAAALVHPSILDSGATITLRANRSDEDPEDVGLRRRQRGPRWTESGGGLRMGRRLELNTHRSLPSPGDPSSVGFITVGPATPSMHHLLDRLGMTGRVPILHLGMVNPIDEAAVERICSRCRNVVVLETHPGAIEDQVLSCIEPFRHGDQAIARIWGRRLPPTPDGKEREMRGMSDLHPSVLGRRVIHLLQQIQPGLARWNPLLPEPPEIPFDIDMDTTTLGPGAQDRFIHALVTKLMDSLSEEGRWQGEPQPGTEEGSEAVQEREPIRLIHGSSMVGPAEGHPVYIELWEHPRFELFGPAAVRQTSAAQTRRLILVSQYPGSNRQDMERLARSAVPASHAEQVTVKRGNLSERDRVMQLLRDATQSDGLSVLILDDGPPVQFDVDAIESTLDEIDRIGFQPMQRLIWPADRACVIRQPPLQAEEQVLAARHALPAKTNSSVDTLSFRWPPRLSGRIRPLVEQVEVYRSRAPIRHQEHASRRIPTPTPRHADQAKWSVHLAGVRGQSPGVAARLLAAVGSEMGYRVRYRFQRDTIGAGRRAWAQLLYTQGAHDGDGDNLSTTIPYGEADLLLGFDRTEALHAVGPEHGLRVASSDVTCGVINTGLFDDQLDLELAGQDRQAIEAYLAFRLSDDGQWFEDFTELCRYRFHNERLADIVQVGTAFQLGWIPATLDAMISAARSMEALGFARSVEALEFGRRLAIAPGSLRRPGEDMQEEDADRIVRRFGHAMRRTGPGRLARTARFRRLVQRTLLTMPGLEETRAGRHARRDLVIALRRCMVWGGFDEAERLSDSISALYMSDRGDRGRMLTHLAVLPLAESTLIRDAIYIASMAVSPEHRRRTRQRLNVKRGREDRIESRYVTRFELVLLKWRFRIDLRTSDWTTKLLAWARRIMPRSWRGTKRERNIRTVVRDLVLRATMEGDRYEHWAGVFQQLNAMALDGRLRRTSPEQLKELGRTGTIEPVDQPEAPEPVAGEAPVTDW